MVDDDRGTALAAPNGVRGDVGTRRRSERDRQENIAAGAGLYVEPADARCRIDDPGLLEGDALIARSGAERRVRRRRLAAFDGAEARLR